VTVAPVPSNVAKTMTPRITLVGGGSTHWTPRLLADVANTDSLQDATVTLVDVDADSLPPMLDVADHMAKCRPGLGLAVNATTDLDEGLDGAEYVVTAFSVGGFASMRHDLEIPARYGVRQPVGDSVGPGGISRSLRSVPVLLGIARAIERRCPAALLLNVTNPLSALCRSVTRETGVRTIGLCNEVVGTQFVLSLLLDADLRRIDPVVAGVNHLPFLTGVTVEGDDGFAKLRALLDDEDSHGAPVWMTPLPTAMHYRKVTPGPTWTKADVIAGNRLKLELFRRFGVLPGSADTHVAEFFPGFVTAASDYGREWSVHHYGLAGHIADKWDDDQGVTDFLASDELTPYPSGELVAPLLDSLLRAHPRPLPMNLPNTGQVQNLDDGVVVECIGVATDGVAQPRDVVRVPTVLGEQLRRVAAAEELTVEAALSGNRTTVLEAMLADPMAGCLPYEHVVRMTDELLAATKPWLPQFES
jgi:alpha-galactosidase/6-phospho-beta-glucosidase family protein